ncbi:hypothetical protein D9615_002537 [Tricholomella constricta]|uniref:Hcy-binding domain-containing protein n=1 Tax=Tricholomella constricta TaxID=117010 RepID=A0A8H5HM49_9AGAR|nr:hypothetical protein D9615_002537 [Tricholomella constricta]
MLLYPTSPVVLDGGLASYHGTTLEELFGMDISLKSPLWSAQQILDHPETIVETHLAFMRAGARIILTSTYQGSEETFRKAGYSDFEATNTMLKAIHLANDARTSFLNESDPDVAVKIALSLGPFGASLSPAQEFDGFYPPPYGPIGFSDMKPMYNAFDEDDVEAEQESIHALAQFHLDRLLIFARDPEAWSIIDIIAFETVPLVREVKAIRMAMLSLKETMAAEGVDLAPKPWWITFVLPNGKCPQTQFAGGPHLTVQDLVFAALLWKPSEQTLGLLGAEPTPTGIGINCTSPELISGLAREMSAAVEQLHAPTREAPWLVLYPNGGDIYDLITRSWVLASDDKRHTWALDLKKTIDVEFWDRPGVWAGVVVGGCCRTGPGLIRQLHDELKAS